MTTVHAIRSSRIVTPAGIHPGVVVILDGKILAIAPFTQPFVEVPVFDVGDHMVLPGLIDIHSQLNEPGANLVGSIRDRYKGCCCRRLYDCRRRAITGWQARYGIGGFGGQASCGVR